MRLAECTAEQFKNALTSDPADKFAKTFLAKANMQCQWGSCVGAWNGDDLMGAIITTVSKRSPKVANLQLLHTFNIHRGKGVGKTLCENALLKSRRDGACYFRVSAEPDAVVFYERIGFKFLGVQKSKCQLSMFRIISDDIKEGEFKLQDPIIYNAVHKKGKGGCVEVFDDGVEDKNCLSSFFE